MIDNQIPNHVAIIMDGNRRWAKERNLPSYKGHLAGLNNLKKISRHIFNKGTTYLSVFAFSTENFKRSEEEVNFLMDLLVKELPKLVKDFKKENIKVVFSGSKEFLRRDVIEAILETENSTLTNEVGTVNICFNYGGQLEIVDAVKKIIQAVEAGNLAIEDLNTTNFYDYLYNNLPPVDLMIRTSGEYRISNFMLYSLAYSEMYFTDTYFPDFNEEKVDLAYLDFNNRNRRFGGNDHDKKNN